MTSSNDRPRPARRRLAAALTTCALAWGTVGTATVALAPAASAASASQYVWGRTPSECTHNAKRYIENWKFGYRSALYTPCRYDSVRKQYWSKVTLYT